MVEGLVGIVLRHAFGLERLDCLQELLSAAAPCGRTAQSLIRHANQLGAQVWDVTAAARQAARRSYDAALRTASDEKPALLPDEG